MHWQQQRRYLHDGPLTSSAGVSAALPVSLALIEEIAGPARAREMALRLGVDDWSAEHDQTFAFDLPDYLRIAANWLAFWRHETLALRLERRMDEIALALAVDAQARTFRTDIRSWSAAPVDTLGGLRIVPDDRRPATGSTALVLPALPAGMILEHSLEQITAQHGHATARLVALQLEFPGRWLRP